MTGVYIHLHSRYNGLTLNPWSPNMYILTMIILFYGQNALAAEQVKVEYTSLQACETAAKANAASLEKTGGEGKVVMATCTAK